ncbi:MAG TPA: MGMT family protein [Candidatus Saccharimonadia bacterium]|nr:MGMT family protein [Candidatus Saccharimonadia bacterium]
MRHSFNSKYSQQVYDLISSIPEGKVTTYGEIARTLKMSSPRTVGTILHFNPAPVVVPCHRVVNAQGKLAKEFGFGGSSAQQHLLEAEGVGFVRGHVDLRKHFYGWS